MEVNEIITNEEVIDTAKEAVDACIGSGFKNGFGLGCITVIAIVAAGKYAVKPIAKKIKTMLDQKKAESGSDTESDISDNEEVDEEEIISI